MPEISLKRLMIFNSSEGHDESREGDKLLYHWSKDESLSLIDQINDVCLCDASVNVGNKLIGGVHNEKTPGDSPGKLILTFEHTLIVILEVEPDHSIWMAVHVAPTVQTDATPESCIPTNAIERVMINIYERFCLLNGTFKMISLKVGHQGSNEETRKALVRDQLRHTCEDYFDSVLPDIHLSSIISNVASLYIYIQYLDLNPLTLMRVNSFINHIVCMNAHQIKQTILIFNDQLVWSSLTMRDTRLLYNYMVSVIIRDALQEELIKEVDKVRRLKENMPIYLMESEDPHPTATTSKNLHQRRNFQQSIKSYLTVFRSRNITLGLVLREPDLGLLLKCEHILTSDSRLGVIPLVSLAQSVGENYLKSTSIHLPSQQGQPSSSNSSAGSGTDYIFMDRLDSSVAWPLGMDVPYKQQDYHQNLIPHQELSHSLDTQMRKSQRLIKHLIDLEPEFEEWSSNDKRLEELYGRTFGDSWLTTTNSLYRTIYSIHNVRNSSLTEAQSSAISLTQSFAKNRLLKN